MDGRPEQKLGCVGESEAEAQTARGVGAADGAGNTVIDIWFGVKRGRFIYTPLFSMIMTLTKSKYCVRILHYEKIYW